MKRTIIGLRVSTTYPTDNIREFLLRQVVITLRTNTSYCKYRENVGNKQRVKKNKYTCAYSFQEILNRDDFTDEAINFA